MTTKGTQPCITRTTIAITITIDTVDTAEDIDTIIVSKALGGMMISDIVEDTGPANIIEGP